MATVVRPSVDWLSLTVDGVVGRSWSAHVVEVLRDHHGGPGYRRGRRQLMRVGHEVVEVDRHWDPVAESCEWGRDYESWHWSGVSASIAATSLDGHGRARRVDVCWDYPCDAEDRPEAVIARWGVPEARQRIEGQGGVNTLYVGARSAAMSLRVYRADLAPNHRDIRVPTMRIEVQLRREAADCWWSLGDWPRRWAHAAAAVRHLVGWQPAGVLDCRLEPVHRSVSPLAQRVATMIDQYGLLLADLLACGVDLERLCRARACGRSARYKAAARRSMIVEVGVGQFTDDVVSLVASGETGAAGFNALDGSSSPSDDLDCMERAS